MGQSSSKTDKPEWKPAYDPCKRYGCQLQACYEEMMKPGRVVTGEAPCRAERDALEQCRQKHNLLTHTPPEATSHKKQ